MPKPLTDSVIKTLRVPRGSKGWIEVSDGGRRGLRIRISPSGEKVWVVRFTVNGQRARHTLGAYPAVTLGEARRRAADYLAAARDGDSPKSVNARREAENMTVGVAHGRYLEAVKPSLRVSTYGGKQRLFELHIEPIAGNRLIRRIKRADVVEVVEAVRAKGLDVQGNRVFSEFMALLRWAEQHEFIDGVPAFKKFKKRERPRGRTLTDSELSAAWQATNQLGDATGNFLRLLVLTLQRRDEVRLMRAEEIDLEQKTWVIPKERYKTGSAHVVPLTDKAIDVVGRLWPDRGNGYILRGRKEDSPFNGAASALRRLRKKVGGRADFTLHDIRRTGRSRLSRLGIDEPTAELVLGHSPRGMVAVYDTYERLDERREALRRWGEVVETLASDESNVVPLIKDSG